MYIKFESHEQKLTALLAIFPAYLLMIVCLPRHSFAIPAFIALAVCVFFTWRSCRNSHSAADVLVSSFALGVSIGFIGTLTPESMAIVTDLKRDIGISHGAKYIDQYDVISALGFTALLGLLTCLRLEVAERILPESIKQPTFSTALIFAFMLVVTNFMEIMHSSPFFYFISSTLALLVIGRSKESLIEYGALSFLVLQSVLTI